MTDSRRPLTIDETGILREIQDFWGPQNGDADVFIGGSDEAAIFATATDGSKPVMVNLTNLGAWLRDGSLQLSTVRDWVQGPLASTSRDRIVTVWMPLLDEGLDVWRPVDAEVLPSGWYRIMSVNEQSEEERWAFPTDAVVVCEYRHLSDGDCLVIAGERNCEAA